LISSILVWYHVPFYEIPRYTYAWLGYKYGATIRDDYALNYTGEQMLTAWQMATQRIEGPKGGTCAKLEIGEKYDVDPGYCSGS